MGRLHEVDSRREAVLPACCLIGRAPICDLVLSARDTSSQHASLEWTGSIWELHDLGSKNGTFVDGGRIGRGEKLPLRRGQRIRFAQQGGTWELADDAPPRPMAVELRTGEVRLSNGGLLALPSDDAPLVTLHGESSERWMLERGHEIEAVGDRAIVPVADGLWRVHLATRASGTLDEPSGGLRVAELTLCFSVSRNEEYVELVVRGRGRVFDLKARAHHYPLLLLARERAQQRAAGSARAEAGWIHQDRLLDMLRMDVSHLNISIHRSRVQLAQEGVVDAVKLIERRPGTRQLRIGVESLEFARL